MLQNALKLNDEKTEILYVSTKLNLQKTAFPCISIGKSIIEPSDKAKNLGVLFDSMLNMESQVNAITKSCFYHLYNVGKIRKYLNKSTVEKVIHAMISSRLDYCNSLLSGVSKNLIGKLQRVQNSAARIVCQVSRREHMTPVLHSLHWLPVEKRIEYKILLLIYKAIQCASPSYLCDILQNYTPVKTLRSSSYKLLSVPKTKFKSYGDRAFSVFGPKLWNKLPERIKSIESIDTFKTELKTFLFKEYYGS